MFKACKCPNLDANAFWAARYGMMYRCGRKLNEHQYADLSCNCLYISVKNGIANTIRFVIMKRASEASLFFLGFPREKKPFHNGSYEHRVPKIKNKTFFCTRFVCVSFNIVIGHLGPPYSTHTAPMPLPTGCVHAHILTKPCAGFAVSRLELIEPGAATCV